MRERPPTPRFSWARRVAEHREALARRRRRLAGAILGACVALALPLAARPVPRLVWNASPSSPIGLHLVSPGQDAALGETVIAWLPPAARTLADRRRYVPISVPIVKEIAAARGDRVCARGPFLSVNGKVIARRLTVDSRGRPLPWWRGCSLFGPSDVLLLGTRPDSFDGRYFGPVSRSSLLGTARLIWAG